MLHWSLIVVALIFGGLKGEDSPEDAWLQVEIAMADDFSVTRVAPT